MAGKNRYIRRGKGEQENTSFTYSDLAYLCFPISRSDQNNPKSSDLHELPADGPLHRAMGRSKCTKALLASFEEAGILRAGRWRIPSAGEVITDPREGEFICFTSHLERGLGSQ